MRSARPRASILIAAIVIAAFLLGIALHAPRSNTLEPRPAKRPTLLLLTSLPLVFGEGFGLSSTGSPTLKALQTRYRVAPISVRQTNVVQKDRESPKTTVATP